MNNLNVENKNAILDELDNIIGEKEMSSLTSSIQQRNIEYKINREFVNNSNENCMEISFYEFKIKDLNIDEAIFCNERLIKLKFFKGDLKPI